MGTLQLKIISSFCLLCLNSLLLSPDLLLRTWWFLENRKDWLLFEKCLFSAPTTQRVFVFSCKRWLPVHIWLCASCLCCSSSTTPISSTVGMVLLLFLVVDCMAHLSLSSRCRIPENVHLSACTKSQQFWWTRKGLLLPSRIWFALKALQCYASV